ncbi:MAG: hypothetical protein H0U71_07095 [Gammaproteobacteria bacterium]|nr:hypothetical protein [Gammaproteobacteria bacterium]
MRKIILSTTVLGDGTGDFHHLLGIVKALKSKQSMNGFEFVILVATQWKETISYFEQCLINLGVKFYLSTQKDFKKDFLNDQSLINDLKEAEQIIRISADRGIVDRDDDFKKHFNPDVKVTYIGEHERTSSFSNLPTFSLGLGGEAFGLKLEHINKVNSVEALQVFQENDPLFANDLLTFTQSNNADDLFSNNILIPAYFNKRLPFTRMLELLAINDNLPINKNIIVSLSGEQGDDYFEDLESFTSKDPYFMNSSIKEVTKINGLTKQISSFVVNPNGSRSIYIFDNYKVSDKSYLTMHQQSMFDGVSGDNTLELAISAKSLPYYHSTNAGAKEDTLRSLIKIIKNLDLPEKIKHDFVTYFENLSAWCQRVDRYVIQKDLQEIYEKYKKLDLPKMMEIWPVVADYLIKHYNFYDRLDSIITGKLVNNNEHYFESSNKSMAQLISTYNTSPSATHPVYAPCSLPSSNNSSNSTDASHQLTQT